MRRQPMDGNGTERMASALGWFSLALGASQIVAPERVAHLIGLRSDRRTMELMRMLGVREATSGLGILASSKPREWVWARVAGDAMDVALLARASRDPRGDRSRNTAATLAVLGAGALDWYVAQRMTREQGGYRPMAAADTGVPPDHGIEVHRSVTIHRPPDEVYGFWRRFENLPRFMRHLESVQDLGNGRTLWKTRAPAGRHVEWEAQTLEDRPGQRIAWRSVDGASVPNEGSVEFRTAPGRRGTEVHVHMRYDPPGGRIGAMFAKLFREEPSQQVRDDLHAFKQVMETGERIVSDATVTRGMHPGQPVASLEGAEGVR